MNEQLEFTLSGRLRNIVLTPSASNCLVPLFEAITNSIHAIEDRFGPDGLSSGKIDIAVERNKTEIASYRVDDNGEGLTPENYKSFITADSPRKVTRGGKGVGRLTWLKVFNSIAVDSYYDRVGVHRLSFRFLQDDIAPIQDKKITPADVNATIGTSVRMEGMHSNFQARRPRKEGAVAKEIIRHFIAYMVSKNAPKFSFYDGDDHFSLSDYFSDAIFQRQDSQIKATLPDGHVVDLNVHHMLVDKKLRDVELGYNTVYLNANGRNVDGYAVDNQLGMQVLRDQFVYMGVVSSPHFDECVSQERTHFNINVSDMAEIKRAISNSTKEFLTHDVQVVWFDQREKAIKVVDFNPRFMTIVGDVDAFIEKNIPLGTRDEEEIHLSFERQYRRERVRFARDYLAAKKTKSEPVIKEKLDSYVGFLNEDIKFALAEYVVRRKAVLDSILEAQAYEDQDKKRHHLERVIHEYICPLGELSDDLTYEDHNLWVIDDRLAFYNYFASDKQLRKVQPQSSDRREPDLALFDAGLGLRRDGSDQPVVIVEFKRPGREDYGSERPLDQVLNYVASLRENGSVKDKSGRVISSLNENTSFIGYIIADLTNGFRATLRGTILNRRTADGLGL
ncbi:MAG: ATP-binding protein [Undibacterium sp.]